MGGKPMSEHARLMAWKTRRAKYGPRGHSGSYARTRGVEAHRRMTSLLVHLHRDGVLSEGQVVAATGLHRVEIRKLVDEINETEAQS